MCYAVHAYMLNKFMNMNAKMFRKSEKADELLKLFSTYFYGLRLYKKIQFIYGSR